MAASDMTWIIEEEQGERKNTVLSVTESGNGHYVLGRSHVCDGVFGKTPKEDHSISRRQFTVEAKGTHLLVKNIGSGRPERGDDRTPFLPHTQVTITDSERLEFDHTVLHFRRSRSDGESASSALPKESTKKLRFVIRTPELKPYRQKVSGACIRIGAAEENDLQIVEKGVSGFHCEIRFPRRGKEIFVKDVGSRNGTHIQRGDGARETLAGNDSAQMSLNDKLILGGAEICLAQPTHLPAILLIAGVTLVIAGVLPFLGDGSNGDDGEKLAEVVAVATEEPLDKDELSGVLLEASEYLAPSFRDFFHCLLALLRQVEELEADVEKHIPNNLASSQTGVLEDNPFSPESYRGLLSSITNMHERLQNKEESVQKTIDQLRAASESMNKDSKTIQDILSNAVQTTKPVLEEVRKKEKHLAELRETGLEICSELEKDVPSFSSTCWDNFSRLLEPPAKKLFRDDVAPKLAQLSHFILMTNRLANNFLKTIRDGSSFRAFSDESRWPVCPEYAPDQLVSWTSSLDETRSVLEGLTSCRSDSYQWWKMFCRIERSVVGLPGSGPLLRAVRERKDKRLETLQQKIAEWMNSAKDCNGNWHELARAVDLLCRGQQLFKLRGLLADGSKTEKEKTIHQELLEEVEATLLEGYRDWSLDSLPSEREKLWRTCAVKVQHLSEAARKIAKRFEEAD